MESPSSPIGKIRWTIINVAAIAVVGLLPVGAQLKPVQPRFEDAFIDLLGGGPGGTSTLAQRTDAVELASDVAVSCRDLRNGNEIN